MIPRLRRRMMKTLAMRVDKDDGCSLIPSVVVPSPMK